MFDTILNSLTDSAVPRYSPGPWDAHASGDRIEVRDSNGRLVADVAASADAHLIALAPEIVAHARVLIEAVAREQPDITDELVDLLELCHDANRGPRRRGAA